MTGNCHVRFLGGGAAATSPCYPTSGGVGFATGAVGLGAVELRPNNANARELLPFRSWKLVAPAVSFRIETNLAHP